MEENKASAPLTGMLTGALQIKKPTTSTNPVSENCLQTKTGSGNSLCLTPTTAKAEQPVPEMNYAYQIGRNVAKAGGSNPHIACSFCSDIRSVADIKQCLNGYEGASKLESPKL